jgi:hypothetical protein
MAMEAMRLSFDVTPGIMPSYDTRLALCRRSGVGGHVVIYARRGLFCRRGPRRG